MIKNKKDKYFVKKYFVLDGCDSGCGGCDYGYYEFQIINIDKYICTVTKIDEAEQLCDLLNNYDRKIFDTLPRH